MPEYPDLYVPDARLGLKMVGYLGSEHYRKADVPTGFVAKLRELQSWPSLKLGSGGFHECGFCQGAKSSMEHITGGFRWPDMLIHYIETHNYLPPDEFAAFVIEAKREDVQETSLRKPIVYPKSDF